MSSSIKKSPLASQPSLQPERELLADHFSLPFIGIDEAGRGPLAGPVIAAAVILPLPFLLERERDLPDEWAFLSELNDSKKIGPKRRQKLFDQITQHPYILFAVGEASAEEIGEINILRATHLAMRRALEGLLSLKDQEKAWQTWSRCGGGKAAGHLLIDGLPVPGLPWQQRALVKGDGRSWSIAAASIVAKVTRDQLMEEIDRAYPNYGFSQHRGYATALHRAKLKAYGPCPYHRRGFAPVDQTTIT